MHAKFESVKIQRCGKIRNTITNPTRSIHLIFTVQKTIDDRLNYQSKEAFNINGGIERKSKTHLLGQSTNGNYVRVC